MRQYKNMLQVLNLWRYYSIEAVSFWNAIQSINKFSRTHQPGAVKTPWGIFHERKICLLLSGTERPGFVERYFSVPVAAKHLPSSLSALAAIIIKLKFSDAMACRRPQYNV
jgi:hypothetical protein